MWKKLMMPLLLFGFVFLGGCYTVNAELPGTLRGDLAPEEIDTIGSFRIQKGNVYFFHGLLGAPNPDFFAADIAKEVISQGGDGVVNLTYEAETSCTDVGITYLTLSIVAPRSYTVSGDVVKIRKAPLPGKKILEAAPVQDAGVSRPAQTY